MVDTQVYDFYNRSRISARLANNQSCNQYSTSTTTNIVKYQPKNSTKSDSNQAPPPFKKIETFMYMYLHVTKNILDLGIDTNLKISPKRLKKYVNLCSCFNWTQ